MAPGGEQDDDFDVVDSTAFRNIVGRLASGVTVVTTRTPDGDFGMTASSVTPLSLEPPLLLMCLNRSVPTCSAVAKIGVFAVNVLGQGSVHLANQFARPSSDKFRGTSVIGGSLGVPLLVDALAKFECRVVQKVDAGTHTIFIGRVVTASAGEGHPLTYFRGAFGRFEFGRDDTVYLRAREQLLSRRYAADSELSLNQMAADLDVDQTGAFYALTRLALDGLVTRDPDRGYIVAPLDASTSDDAFAARTAIEIGVIELTIEELDATDLQLIRAKFELMAELLVGDRFVDFERYLDANSAFHEAIVSLAHSSALTAAFGQLGLRTVMARSFGATIVTSQSFINVQRDLVEALERGDGPMAKDAVRAYSAIAGLRVREILTSTDGQL